MKSPCWESRLLSYVEKSAVSIAKPKCWLGTEIRDDGYALISGEKLDAVYLQRAPSRDLSLACGSVRGE